MITRACSTLIAGLILVVVLAPMATAEGESIGGTLISRGGDERTPVEGVTVTVSQGDEEIGSATSDSDGRWDVPVPGPGTYQVTLDVATLPVGIGLSDPERNVLSNVEVATGQSKSVLFPIGEGGRSAASSYTRVGSLFIAGLKLGAVIALCAVGLSLIYAVTGLVNFAHGEMVTLGALLAYFFHTSHGGPRWPLLVAAIPAVLLSAGFGWVQDRWLWRPLRKRSMGLLAMMVVSIGLAFALRHIYLVAFGGLSRAYRDFTGQRPFELLAVLVIPKHLITIGAAIVILGGVGLFLQQTKIGTALRAVSDDAELSESTGINVDRIVAATWILSAGLAALGGIFFGSNESIQWDMGFRLLLLIFAAVVLGGLGTAYGAMVGGFAVGITVEMSTFLVASELKYAIGLGLLILMLLVRPQGLLGTRERIG